MGADFFGAVRLRSAMMEKGYLSEGGDEREPSARHCRFSSNPSVSRYTPRMQSTILLRPSYSALRLLLDAGEEIHAESGSMLAMDATATIEGTMKGGAIQALKRAFLTSESFFVTTIRASQDNTEVYLAPRATGDIQEIELDGHDYLVQGGSFLASVAGVQTDAKFTGWQGFLSGEGIFMIKATGTGKVYVSSFGGIIEKTLADGEKFIVDNGHIVAFDASIPYEIQRAGTGMFSMVTTGEGLVCVFTGPGKLYLQSRNLRSFAETLNPFLPKAGKSQGSGFLGQVMGG
jgi:uncharacterized protein (TIGR00266 family)